jgi:RNA polymerase sigma-70 factor (ECF subfamily)
VDPEISDITFWLHRIREGDKDAESLVFEHLQHELRVIARRYLTGERKGHSLQSTVLVDEAYMRLVRNGDRTWQNRNQFLALAARVMRHFLVDYARAKLASKRGGQLIRVELEECAAACSHSLEELLALHRALDRLSEMDCRLGQIVEMQYFGGMTDEEIGKHLDLSVRTVKCEVRAARAWLADELGGDNLASSPQSSR